jgi:hypothetical protein
MKITLIERGDHDIKITTDKEDGGSSINTIIELIRIKIPQSALEHTAVQMLPLQLASIKNENVAGEQPGYDRLLHEDAVKKYKWIHADDYEALMQKAVSRKV